MAIKINLKQSTNLVLNPVIHSFLEFLPLNRLEFSDKIKNEVESNPMLELQSTEPLNSDPAKEINKIESKLEKADSSFLNTYEENGFFKRSEDKLDKNRAIELFTASKISLGEHLMIQADSVFDKRQKNIAKNIIYNLNKDGYLELEVESIAMSLDSTPEELEEIRSVIMGFDPLGSGARDLRECLLVQVEDNEENSVLRKLISDCLEDLSRSKYSEIMSKLSIDQEELNFLLKEIKRLNPRPGRSFETEEVEYAGVDLILVKVDDEYKVRYVEEGMPRLLLSNYYEEMMNSSSDKKTASYLKERNRSAQLFIEGIELRKKMIVRIAEFLVKVQKDYLDFGSKWKKPLTMKDVAKELGYNESTISRAVSNKFMASENGLISLKSFFSYGIKGEFGFTHSVETIKDKINQMIEEEPKEKPLSDQVIAEKLGDLGIRISRRTIRNYRDELNLPSSSKRKQKYNLLNES